MSLREFILSILVLFFTDVETAPPVMTTTPVVKLYEDQAQNLVITSIVCTDPDGDGVVVSGRINPQQGCPYCMVALPVDVDAGTYDLTYFPSVADLDFNQVPEITVTLTCDDGNGGITKENVIVRLYPNSAPYFDAGLVDFTTVYNTKGVTANTPIHSVAASDPDLDPIYYTMTTSPASNDFAIGYTDGVIRAVNDLSKLCEDFITFEVTISDGKINNVGPQIITATLEGANKRPEITNLDRFDLVREDTPVGQSLLDLQLTTNAVTTALTMTTNPQDARKLFQLVGTQIQLAQGLDYEDFVSRRPLIYITADDGGCPSRTYTYTVSVTDVNEPPVIKPTNAIYEIYEGNIKFDPSWNTFDPDIDDFVTYSIIGARPSNAALTINPDTGVLLSTTEWDVDQNAMSATVTLTIQVTDKYGLKNSTTVILHIKDANDNAPVITTKDLYFTVTNCTIPGINLGTFQATDRDSSFQDNNVISFAKVGGGGGVVISPDGDVILNQVFPAGTSATYSVVATDHGQYPGPLSCLVLGTVTISSTPCPTTTTRTTTTSTTTTTTTTTTTPTTTTTTTTTPTPETFSTDDNLWWIILSALGGTAFVGLTAWLCLSRVRLFCARGIPVSHWMRGCGGREGLCRCEGELCRRRTVSKPKKTRVIEIKPREQENRPKAGNFEDRFWKERFPDDNYTEMPDRNRTPAPADYDGTGTGEQPGIPRKPKVEKPEEDRDIWSSNVKPDYGQINSYRNANNNYANPNPYNVNDIL